MPKKTIDPEAKPPQNTDFLVLLLTIASTIIVTFITYVNPQTKWQQLRGAAQALRAEMWKFRTRSGIYQQTSGQPANQASLRLKDFVDDVSKNVMKSATIANTRVGKGCRTVSHFPKALSVSLSSLAGAHTQGFTRALYGLGSPR